MPNPKLLIKPNVLIIDDSTIDLQLLIEMMSARHMRVNVAFNGHDGYNKAVLHQPNLILLDVVMPVLNGFSTLRMLKNNERTRYIPVIFLSASSDVEKRVEGLSLGAVDYIGKPFNEEEVIARVEVQLNMVRNKIAPMLDDGQYSHLLNENIQNNSGVNKANSDAINASYSNMDSTNLNRRDVVLIRTATEYLRQHLNQPHSLNALAAIFGTNEKRLNHAFQVNFAMPVFAWLREERLRQARDLVASTETSIASIGQYLGYSSPANFSRAFQERFKCSPRELRKQLQLNQLTDQAKES
jgi:YesN/AraC family two-component response regulator